MDLFSRLRRAWRRRRIEKDLERYEPRPAGYETFSDDRTQYAGQVIDQLPAPDLIHLHWVSAFIDIGSFLGDLRPDIPLVWTLHDMNAITGGCHCDMGCGRWVDGCGSCPQLGSKREGDLSRRIWERKRRCFSEIPGDRLRVVTPSRWLARAVEKSPILRDFPVEVIPNGLDTEVFCPRDRAYSRRLLGVAPGAAVVLFVSTSLERKVKGLKYAVEAVEGCASVLDPLVLCVGDGEGPRAEGVRVQSLGSVQDERLMSAVYSAADVCVVPSLQDNLPNSVMEAMACGTPVVGFDVGGTAEMVRCGETGLLVPTRNTEALAEAISTLLRDEKMRKTMSGVARSVSLEHYRSELQAQRYCGVYQELLESP
jgi:glycosyltransferase involved in cell wall biosynthesis